MKTGSVNTNKVYYPIPKKELLGSKPSNTTPSDHQEVGDRADISLSANSEKGAVSKKLCQKWLQQSQRQGVEQAVIIGAGPAGLAAAIALAKRDIDVTVLEMRSDDKGEKPLHARPHQISLRQDTLNSLKGLGAYDEVIGKSGYVEKESMVLTDGTAREVREKKPQGKALAGEGSFINPALLDTDSVSQVRISDVEKALYTEAKKLGVKVKAGVTAELKRDGQSYGVTAHRVEQTTGRYEKTGQSENLGTPDLVVVADGSGSPMRESLGIAFKGESEEKHYLGGHFHKGVGATTTKVAISEPEGFTRHVMGTGHSQYEQTWVSAEITPEEAALPPAERTKLLAGKAQWIFPDAVSTEDIGWGAGQVTTVQNRRAERTTAGDNLVLIGDSAGTGSVWVGGGLNLALTTHLKALDTLVTNLRNKGDRGAEPSLKSYDKAVQWATTRWHKAGASQLSSAAS